MDTASAPWVFPEHADVPDYELAKAGSQSFRFSACLTAGRSSIDDLAATVVDFLCAELADYAYGEQEAQEHRF